MKIVLVAFLFGASALAQNSSSVCGPENVSFKVTLDKSHSSLPKPEPGKATVVFIQDFGAEKFGIGVHVITRIGVDGSWVGAPKDNSYSSVLLEPGERHVCVNLDSALRKNRRVCALHSRREKCITFAGDIRPAAICFLHCR